MTSDELLADDRKRAERIYKRAMWKAAIVLWILYFGGELVVLVAARKYLQWNINGSWLSGFGAFIFFGAHLYATRQVRKAGLSLAQTQMRFIPKTATRFDDEPLEVYASGLVTIGWIGLVFSSLTLLGFLWLQSSGSGFRSLWEKVTVPLPLAAMWVGSLYLSSSPVALRLNQTGVYA